MTTVNLKHKLTANIIFTCKIPKEIKQEDMFKYAVELAVSQGISLAGVNLRNKNLEGANFQGADLRDADFWHANLNDALFWNANLWNADFWCANLEGATIQVAKNSPLIINGLYWKVYISGTGMMRIGCQNHSIKHWAEFSDTLISRMDGYALIFWKQHKAMLMNLCNNYKHKVK